MKEKKPIERKSHHLLFAILISLILISLTYPTFLTMECTPMAGKTWELHDPVTSYMNFIPGRNVIRYEIFENGNLLWSNLRGAGLPILANDIQVAPLFPLSILLFWVPGTYYWNIYVVLSIILLAVSVYFVAIDILKFKPMAAIFFMFNFVFAIYVLRNINHPWLNGLLAGLWYIYFLGKLPDTSSGSYSTQRLMGILGLLFSVYSLVTCGFPEAAAMSGILACLVCPFVFIHHIRRRKIRFKSFGLDLLIGHGLGFALSCPQLFALIEFINLAMPEYRQAYGIGYYGLAQYPLNEFFTYFLAKITSFSNGKPPGHNIHLFGLIPLFLFFYGFFFTLRKIKSIKGLDIAAILCGLFFIVKLFPFWPWFNQFIGNLPILKESWFRVYFFSIFLWFFAYFVARGVDGLLRTCSSDSQKQRIKLLSLTTTIAIFIIISLFYASPIIGGMGYIERLKTHVDYISLKVLSLFFLFIFIFILFTCFKPAKRVANIICIVFFGLMVCEFVTTRPADFLALNDFNQASDRVADGVKITRILKKHSISPYEARIKDPDGRYVSQGIATIDDGAAAILQERLRRFRLELFELDWHYYLPVKKPKFPYSWRLLSNNLYVGQKEELHRAAPFNYDQFTKLASINENESLYYDKFALPRAYIPSRCFSAKDIDESAAYIADENWFLLGDAYIEDLTENEIRFCEQYTSSVQSVKIIRDEGRRIILENIKGPAILVLNDNYYPGWQAIDRKTGDTFIIKPANMTFRALILQGKREYSIVFKYLPEWTISASILILISLFSIIYLLYFYTRKNMS